MPSTPTIIAIVLFVLGFLTLTGIAIWYFVSRKSTPDEPTQPTPTQPAPEVKPTPPPNEPNHATVPSQEAAKQEAVKQEAAKQQEAVKQEAAKQEAAKQEAVKQEAAKQEAVKQQDDNIPASVIFYSGANYGGNASVIYPFYYVMPTNKTETFCCSFSINNFKDHVCTNPDGSKLTHGMDGPHHQLMFIPQSAKFFNKNNDVIQTVPQNLQMKLYGWNGGKGVDSCGKFPNGTFAFWPQVTAGNPDKYKDLKFDYWTISNAANGYLYFFT